MTVQGDNTNKRRDFIKTSIFGTAALAGAAGVFRADGRAGGDDPLQPAAEELGGGGVDGGGDAEPESRGPWWARGKLGDDCGAEHAARG